MEYVADKIGDDYTKWGAKEKIIISAPTGTGKTYFILNILLPYAIANGKKIFYLVNRRSLKAQLDNELTNMDRELNRGQTTVRFNITIETYQNLEDSLRNSSCVAVLNKLAYFDYVVYDECHYFYSDSSFNTYNELSYDCLRAAFLNKIEIFISATIDNMRYFIHNRVSANVSTSPLTLLPYSEASSSIYEYKLQQDYSYINLKYFSSLNEIETQIIDDTSSKWLIFSDSIEQGTDMAKRLSKALSTEKNAVGFIDAKYSQTEDSQLIFDEITQNNYTNKRILIATAVIDNGISIKDENLRNIVIMADTEETFKQMLGRKRIDDDTQINLYVCKRDSEYFRRRSVFNKRVLEFYEKTSTHLNSQYVETSHNEFVFPLFKYLAFEVANGASLNRSLNIYPMFTYYNSLIQESTLEGILDIPKYYHYGRRIIYPFKGYLATNSFSLCKHRNLQIYYDKMIDDIDNDEYAFIKKQAEWLSLDFETQVLPVIIENEESNCHQAIDNIIRVFDKYKHTNGIVNDNSNGNAYEFKKEILESAKIVYQYCQKYKKDTLDDAKSNTLENALKRTSSAFSFNNIEYMIDIFDIPYSVTKQNINGKLHIIITDK